MFNKNKTQKRVSSVKMLMWDHPCLRREASTTLLYVSPHSYYVLSTVTKSAVLPGGEMGEEFKICGIC